MAKAMEMTVEVYRLTEGLFRSEDPPSDEPGAARCGLGAGEHRRGTRSAHDPRLCALPVGRQGPADGDRDVPDAIEAGLGHLTEDASAGTLA